MQFQWTKRHVCVEGWGAFLKETSQKKALKEMLFCVKGYNHILIEV